MQVTLYKDIKLRDGTILSQGETVSIRPSNDDRICHCHYKDRCVTLRYTSVVERPDMDELNQAVYDGVCESISGDNVEPDGHDSDGFPSWLLALGLI